MSEVQMYWFLKLDDIRTVLEGISIPFLVIGTLAFIGYIISKCIYITTLNDRYERDTTAPAANEISKFVLPIMFIGLSIGILFQSSAYFIPSTKQMAAIYVVPKLVNNKQIQEIPNRILTLANEWLEELRPDNINESAKPRKQRSK